MAMIHLTASAATGASSERPVRIGMQTWGSEGDIRPFIALAAGLTRRGHDVELVYTDFEDRHFEGMAAGLGVRARAVATPVVADPDEVTRIGLQIVNAANPLVQAKILVDRFFTPVSSQIYDAALDLCARCDVLVGHFFLYQLRAAAALQRRPEVSVMFAHHLVPSRAIHPTGLPRLGTWGNILGWRLARLAINRVLGPEVNRFRRRVGLAPIDDVMRDAWASPRLNLVAVSPTLCVPPTDWAPHHRVTGFLALPDTAQEAVPDEVEAFLGDGPPPVFMGFGSLMPRDPALLEETVANLRQAAARAGCRAIIHVPPGSSAPVGRDGHTLVVGRVSHAAVFPRCAAIVHHGGAGTTHSVLRAGVPSIVVPHVADQFFWAEELTRLGVSPKPLPRRRLNARALAGRLRVVLGNERMSERARELAARIEPEDGVRTAADLIEGVRPGLERILITGSWEGCQWSQ